MDSATLHRLFNLSDALAHPAVRALVYALVLILALFPLLILALSAMGKLSPALKKDLWDRFFSWLLFIPMMVGPILLGAAWVFLAVALLALFCYREFARATGLFRERTISAVVVLGILLVNAASADHWYGLFTALPPIMIGLLGTTAVLADRPQGYIQRLALGIFAFMLFGVCCGHLSFIANDPLYRPILLWLLASVELNDIFAYITGKSFGRQKLAPNTSPNKTVAGSIGAIILTTAFAALVGHHVFKNTPMDQPHHLLLTGLLLSIAGQFGDLTLSSIKRDLGIKDWSNTFPGHGGLLDRFNSLLFAAPPVFHYLHFILNNLGASQPKRIFM